MSKWQSERSIHEMLKDTPPIRESSDSINSGTEAKFPTSHSMPFTSAYAPPDTSSQPTSPTPPQRDGASRVMTLKEWSLSTYRCTKQMLYEKLGKSTRTVDTELETQIEMLRETQRKYNNVLRLARALTSQWAACAATQQALGEAFADLAQKSPELQPQFLYNADTQRSLVRNSGALLAALAFFTASLDTLANRSIADTLLTVRLYEQARIEYDAARLSAEGGAAGGLAPPPPPAQEVGRLRARYERLRDDVAVKMTLLHENRVKVMNKQLLLFHNAIAAYFSGNKASLEAAVRHCHGPPAPPPPPPTH